MKIQKEHVNQFFLIIALIGIIFLANYIGIIDLNRLFTIIGENFNYTKSVTFLGNKATLYSTQPFFSDSASYCPSPTDREKCVTTGYNIIFDDNLIGVSSFSQQSNSKVIIEPIKYFPVSAYVDIENKFNFTEVSRISFSYTYSSKVSCVDNVMGGGGIVIIYLNNIPILELPSAKFGNGDINQEGVIELKPIGDNLIINLNGEPHKVIPIDKSTLYNFIIYSHTGPTCNVAGYSNSAKITIDSFNVEKREKKLYYRIIDGKCVEVLIYNDEKTILDFETLSECQDKLQKPCEEGEEKCVGDVLWRCENKEFKEIGNIEGKCGYEKTDYFKIFLILLIPLSILGILIFIVIFLYRKFR